MKTKALIITGVVVIVLLCAGLIYTIVHLQKEKENTRQLTELAEMEKKEMENEYTQFALQYDELKRSIRNDSLLQRLTEEENRTRSLLAELKRVKSTDAAEITRLKKELETVRAVLRSYIMQVDSLNQVNQSLTRENEQVKQRYQDATTQISSLTTERQSLADQVAIASQLDATNISISMLNKRGKNAKKTKDVTSVLVSFTITKNITAQTGNRHIYVRLSKPGGDIVSSQGSFNYENRQLSYSATRMIEYTGEEQNVEVYITVSEYLSAGTYTAYIFADDQMIGQASKTMEK